MAAILVLHSVFCSPEVNNGTAAVSTSLRPRQSFQHLVGQFVVVVDVVAAVVLLLLICLIDNNLTNERCKESRHLFTQLFLRSSLDYLANNSTTKGHEK